MKIIVSIRSKKKAVARSETTSSNCKRSRLMAKTDAEIILEILVMVEKVGSFCPEILMRNDRSRIFEESYRRFETWGEIVEKCILFSNEQNLIGKQLKTPREIVLEILRLESRGESLSGNDVAAQNVELYDAAVMFYGSWNRALAVVGIKQHDKIGNLSK